jgi:hypothetical protein
MDNPQVVTQNGYLREKAYLCVATGKNEDGYAYFTQRNKIKEGDICEIITPGKVGKRFIATDLRLPNGDKIDSAPHPSMEFKMKVPYDVNPGDIVRSSEE